MIFAGYGIVPGSYGEGPGVTNVNLLRTVESIYGLTPSGAQSPLASLAGIGNAGISDIFVAPLPSVQVFGKRTRHTGERKYRLKGTATDVNGALFAVEIEIGGKSFAPANGTTTCTYNAKLSPGKNVIRVRAVDRSGATSPVVKLTIYRNMN
jgi:hypothetical protein